MSLVTVARDGAVAEVVLTRTERHNALVPELLDALVDAVGAIEADPAVRAVLLRGEGRSLSTGGDVAAFAAHEGEAALTAYAERVVGRLNDAILALARLPVPLVVAWQGPVTGGALGLVLPADAVVAAEDAWLQPYYAQVGFAPDGGWTAWLPDVVGRPRAAWVLVHDRRVEASQLREWGLVSEVVPGAELLPRARAIAAHTTSLRPGAQGAARRLLARDAEAQDRDGLAARLEAERRAFVAQVATDEAREGMRAFLAGSPSRAPDA